MSKLGIQWARARGAGASPYVAKAVHFDGNTWLNSSTALGAVNGPRGIWSYWGFQTSAGALCNNVGGIVDTASSGACILQGPGGVGSRGTLGNTFGITFSPDGTAFTTNTSLDNSEDLPVGSWFHILMSWDWNFSAGQKLISAYVNDVLTPFDSTTCQFENSGTSVIGSWPAADNTPAFNLQYNDGIWSILQWGYSIVNNSLGTPPFASGDMSDLYVNTVSTIAQSDSTILTADRRNSTEINRRGMQPFGLFTKRVATWHTGKKEIPPTTIA